MEYPEIKTLQAVRRFIYNQVKDLPEDSFYIIPENFKTNIIWNLGHLIVSQQNLTYKKSSLPLKVNNDFAEKFSKGTSPCSKEEMPSREEVLKLFLEIPDLFEKDLSENLFSSYEVYPASSGMVLENINDAISYNNFHEGLHLGIIQSILKFI